MHVDSMLAEPNKPLAAGPFKPLAAGEPLVAKSITRLATSMFVGGGKISLALVDPGV